LTHLSSAEPYGAYHNLPEVEKLVAPASNIGQVVNAGEWAWRSFLSCVASIVDGKNFTRNAAGCRGGAEAAWDAFVDLLAVAGAAKAGTTCPT
jgi:hypothetical protein